MQRATVTRDQDQDTPSSIVRDRHTRNKVTHLPSYQHSAMQDPTDRVCLFHLRCGTCRSLAEGQQTTRSNGQKMCPNGLHLDPSEARQEGISTKFADRRWHVAQTRSGHSKAATLTERAEWDVRIMTYNILAEGLATAHGELLYKSVPHWCLQWEYRWPGLLAEIRHYQPDVMSLQEVDHMDELEAALGPLGYEGRYAKRSGGRSDGCATFWRKDKFWAVAVDVIRFQTYNLQDNVAILVLLHRKSGDPDDEEDEPRDGAVEVNMTVDESGDVSMLSGEVHKWFTLHAELPSEARMDPALLVANTHILFNPKRGDIKIAQARTLLSVMNDIVHKCNGNALAMVMGDFNSTPESAVYRFIKAGELDCQTVSRKLVSGQIQGTSWPAAMEKMARQRSAPPALSLETVEEEEASSPLSTGTSELGESDSPERLSKRLKPFSGKGMSHVVSEPHLAGLAGSDEEDEDDSAGEALRSRGSFDEERRNRHINGSGGRDPPAPRGSQAEAVALQTLPDSVPNPTRLRISPSMAHIRYSALPGLASASSQQSGSHELETTSAEAGSHPLQVEIEPNSPPGVRRRSFEFSSSRRAASPGSTKSSSMESAGLQQSGSLRRSSSLERLPTPSLGEPLPGMEVLTTAKSPLITVEVPSPAGQPVLPSRSPSAAKAEAAKQMLLQQSRQMPCSPALSPEATVGDRVLQDAQPLKRISSLKTDASKELSTVEILAQSQQAAKEAAEHQAAEHQAQRPPRSLESAQAAGLPPAGPSASGAPSNPFAAALEQDGTAGAGPEAHPPGPASASSGAAHVGASTLQSALSPRGHSGNVSPLAMVAEDPADSSNPFGDGEVLSPSSSSSRQGPAAHSPRPLRRSLAESKSKKLDSSTPPTGRRPLFRDDSCTWSPEHLQMAVGCLPEELQAWASKADADRQQQATEADEGEQQAEDAAHAAAAEGANDPAQPTWIARHPLKLRSAYNEVCGREPDYTTCHSKFLGTVDYMWYTPNADAGTTLTPMRTLEPPPLQHLYCGLPCPEWQSDHISLVTDFCVSRQSSKRSVMLKSVIREQNMVRARSKTVDNAIFPAMLASAGLTQRPSQRR